MRTSRILTLLVTAGTLSVPAFANQYNPLNMLAFKTSDSCEVVKRESDANGFKRLYLVCTDYAAAKDFMDSEDGVMLFDSGLAWDGKARNFQIELKKPIKHEKP